MLQVPDGSFSRGVRKAGDLAELDKICAAFFGESELLLAQRYVPTVFDRRVGVVAGEPLHVCQYRMARNHWQIVDHRPDGRRIEGGFRTRALEDAPRGSSMRAYGQRGS